jgi:hypothetical protein
VVVLSDFILEPPSQRHHDMRQPVPTTLGKRIHCPMQIHESGLLASQSCAKRDNTEKRGKEYGLHFLFFSCRRFSINTNMASIEIAKSGYY